MGTLEEKGGADMKVELGTNGISLGSAIAVAISWTLYKSIWWAILHGVFGWLYVIYYAIWL